MLGILNFSLIASFNFKAKSCSIMKFLWIFLLALFFLVGEVFSQFGGGMKEPAETDADKRRKAYLASRKAAKISSTRAYSTSGADKESEEEDEKSEDEKKDDS